MRTIHLTRLLAFCLLHSAFCLSLRAQGNAFTYQGRLADATGPANGSYDFRFTAYTALSAGSPAGTVVTTNGVAVSNGLFTVALDLGTGVFTGAGRWLQVEVRTNGATSFNPLTPRQSLTPSPYALYAPSAGTATTANTVIAGAVTSAAMADGAVTTSKIAVGAVKPANIDDGGAAAYESLMTIAKSFATTESLSFEALSLVSSNSGTAPSFEFYLEGAAFGTVMAFTGREGMSELFEYVVQVLAPHPELVPDAQMGRQAYLRFLRNGRNTRFAGVVTGCSVASHDDTAALYTFRLESPLTYLSLSTDYRIYQEKTVPEVVDSLYTEVTSTPLHPSLTGFYSRRDYVVQFAETDLDFFSRLLEDQGIFYLFDPEGVHPILGDDSGAYLTAPNSPFRYYGNTVTNIPIGLEVVRTFHKSTQKSTRRSTIRSYDFERPTANLTGTEPGTQGRGDRYVFGSTGTAAGENTTLASRRVERYDLERATISGSANAPDLRPGHVFTVDDRTDAGLAGEYLVTATRHGAFRRLTNGVAALFYGNQFEVIPAHMTFRPAVKTPKPQANASTAVVTGPAGQEIHVDEHGRAKVRFHWDRRGAIDDTASAWLRQTSPWAGAGWGMVFLPRVGQEVLVEFLNGDPDQPVITGSLYNGLKAPPYALPENKTVSTIKTRSSPGGTGGNENEIRFEDKKGSEMLQITAEKDFMLSADHDTTISLGNNTTIDLGVDLTMGVGHDATFHAAHALSASAGATMAITAPSLRLSANTTALNATNALDITAGATLAITAPSLTLSASQGIGIGIAGDPALALKVNGTVSAASFQGSGSALTNLPAVALTGTVSDARLSGNVPRLNAVQSFTAANSFLGPVGIGIASDPAVALKVSGTVMATSFQGSGSALTNVPATALTGTINDARLPANLARLNVAQSFSAANAFLGPVGIGGAAGTDALTLSGNARLNDNDLFLRANADLNQGLGWYGLGKLFAGVNIDGPVLYGWTGGGLGSMNGGARLALQWDATGNVAMDGGNQNAGSLAPGLVFGGVGSGEGISSKRTAGANQFSLNFHTGFSNRMTILATGDVGIGTLNPARRLHVMDGSGATQAGGSIQVGKTIASSDPKLIYFGDGDYVHLGENGQDDTMELKASRFFFAGGNLGIDTNNPAYKIHLAGGAYCNGLQWVNASDRDRKEGFQAVNTEEVLKRVADLPLSTWSYKEDPSSRHVGPTAQDFHAAFGFGKDDKAIGTVDADGVALAAIQGLNEKVEVGMQNAEGSIRRLEAENAELKRRLEKLEQLLMVKNGGVH